MARTACLICLGLEERGGVAASALRTLDGSASDAAVAPLTVAAPVRSVRRDKPVRVTRVSSGRSRSFR